MPNFVATVRGTLISVVPGGDPKDPSFNAMLLTAPVGEDKHPGMLEVRKWPKEVEARSQGVEFNAVIKDYVLDNGRRGMSINFHSLVEPSKGKTAAQQQAS